MNQDIAGNETRIEIRNCKETEFLNRITIPHNLDVANNKTFKFFVQKTEDEYQHKKTTESVTHQQTASNILINDTKYSSNEENLETNIIFYYLTIGLGSLSGILLVSLIIFGVLFR